MGSSENEAPKPSNQAQDQPPATSSLTSAPAYPDWSGFQAYSPIPPHGFFPSPVASGSPAHPYMWGPQAIMPPFGTPPPPYVMYPPGVYAHPPIPPASHPYSPYAIPSPVSNAEAFGIAAGGPEGPSPEGKERGPLKSSKGSLGSLNMITGKNNNDPGKTSGASANEGISHSGESGSEDSSDGSDVNSQHDSQPKTYGGPDSNGAEAPQNGDHARSSGNGVTGTPHLGLSQTMAVMPMPAAGVAGPTTNLNIGMDCWGPTTPTPIPPMGAKVQSLAVGGAIVPSGPSDMWIQDERELKRQRRKQSNRESARRSRLRKQAECEELAQRVEVLKEENASLRAELNHVRNEYDQLLSQNTALKEKLGEAPRGEKDSKIDRNGRHSLDIQAAQNDTVEGGH